MSRLWGAVVFVLLVISVFQTWRLERVRLEWATERAVTAEGAVKELTDTAATITALRGTFEEIMETANALPNADACGFDDGRVRALDAIQHPVPPAR